MKLFKADHGLTITRSTCLIAIAAIFLSAYTITSAGDGLPEPLRYRHSIDFCPMSPLFKIYAIHYCYKMTPKDELILAPYYANIHYKDIGNTDAPGFIVGYRRYFWRNLHMDYQLMPQWDHYYDLVADSTYPLGFDLWNEFRLGYSWDFQAAQVPCFINVQWPFGFALYSDKNGKPESFKKKAREEPYFYFPPMFFVGVRF